MKISKAKFITSQVAYSPLSDYPEVALVGRSNVGKSSLINALTNHGKLAKTSNTPGRTRLINFFEINESFYLVDLPGYGFSQSSKTEAQRWGRMIEGYLNGSTALKLVLLLLDARREPSTLDKVMLNYLYEANVPFIPVITKADKLSRAALNKSLLDISASLALGRDNLIVTSSTEKTGFDTLFKEISGFLDV